MPTYALLGYPLSHSFSRGYFTAKFRELGLAETHEYLNFELSDLKLFKQTIEEFPDLAGCNVTIPHKKTIIPYLDFLDPVAERIGAVNTIKVEDGRLTGYNTDYLGFRADLLLELQQQRWNEQLAGNSALILGTGGASLGIEAALTSLGVHCTFVSRSPAPGQLSYDAIDARIITRYHLIVNTTPLGMSPAVDAAPELPYGLLTPAHFCYDLIYNPAETRFLRQARDAGAGAANGLGMLHKQAEAAWAIWTEK